MATHLLRDYVQQQTSSNRHTGSYVLALYLRRVLGFSHVGSVNFQIQSPGETTIAVASNGQTLPQATVNVASTAGFPSAGNICVATSTGVANVIYTGTTGTSFTGCTGAGGTMSTGGAVTAPLIRTGDTNPTGVPNFPAGTKAGINFGVGFVYEVSIPAAVRTVSAADIGRVLVLKSTANPRHNSGLFLITGVNVGSNRYIINWRSGDSPPAEAADSIEWWLYAADAGAFQNIGGSNSGTGYRSFGSATCPRIILQSPHSTAWQVRICNESNTDFNTNQTVPIVTVTTGYNGDASGDWQTGANGGRHTHPVFWWDSTGTTYRAPGMIDTQTALYRYTAVGDDTGQAVAFFVRHPSSSTSSFYVIFGLADEEPAPIPTEPSRRIFALGQQRGGVSGITFAFQPVDTSNVITCGATMGFAGVPVTCSTGCWTYASGPGQRGSHFYDASAGDSPWLGSTELVTVELVAGALHCFNQSVPRTVPLEPRLMGVVPHLRQGRTNFGEFTLTTDAGKSWQHMREGVYMPWGGPAVLP